MLDRKKGERSFTLLETIIALGLMVTILLEVASVQGNALNFSTYERNLTQATWLGKALLAQIEYKANFYPLSEMNMELKEQEFKDDLCPKDSDFGCDFRYDLTIKERKLPLIDIILGNQSQEDENEEPNPMTELIKDQLKSTLGDELLKVANIKVTWPEGSKRNDVQLTYLLTNQLVLDQKIEQLSPPGGEKSQSTPTCAEGQVMNADGKCVPIDSDNL